MNKAECGAYVIHLKRATQRRAQVDRIVEACPLTVRVLDAVDGRALSDDARNAVHVRDLHEPRYPFEIGPGEVGCFLSHRAAWQAILDDGLSAGLIIEDDVEIDAPVFGKALELALSSGTPRSYVQFQARPAPGGGTVVARGEGVEIRRPVTAPRRTSAQLVGRDAAQQLLEVSQRFDRPVDGLLQMPWVTGVDIDIVVPSGISDRTGATGGSTIQTRTGVIDRISREFKRAAYRTAIARRSAKEAGKR